MTIPKITPYSGVVANPDGSQTQTEFTQNMFDQLSYEAELSTELNSTVDGINDTSTQVDADATSAAQSAAAAEAAAYGLNYQGLWPDTDGSANKGDTYQTQVSGTPTGQYFTALQNTTVDPVGDDVNWIEVVSNQSLGNLTNYQSASVSDMKEGKTLNGQATITPSMIDSFNISISTQGYYGSLAQSKSYSGSGDYLIVTISRAREILDNSSWTPDGLVDHYMFGGSSYVALLDNKGSLNIMQSGAVGDGTAITSEVLGTDDTASLQSWLNYGMSRGVPLNGVGLIFNHTGLLINKDIRIDGYKKIGADFGSVLDSTGFQLKQISLSGAAVTIDASGNTNSGLSVSIQNIGSWGNLNIPGAVSGGGWELNGDTSGETYFVEGSVFRDVQVTRAKQSAWVIRGTCFSNDWYDCVGGFSGDNGLRHDKGLGNPVNNNFTNCSFWDNGGFGFSNNGGKCTLTTCNISQNYSGGVDVNSGYIILSNCDYEYNRNVVINLTNCSQNTRIVGGMIHKSPSKEAVVGIKANSGTSNVAVEDVLFANFDNPSDRIFTPNGGTLKSLTFRAQNVLSTAMDPSRWASVANKPAEGQYTSGSVTFSGSGSGTRTAVINFEKAFSGLDYVVFASPNTQFGVDPSTLHFGVDYGTAGSLSITATLKVDTVGAGDITIKWGAIGK